MKRVLLADDHPIILSGEEALLRNSRYEVVARVADGDAVLEVLEDAAPDVLILDIRMPGCSGLEVLRRLRARGDERAVILLTADIDVESANEALRLRANAIVLKETAGESLLSCLDAVGRGERWIDDKLKSGMLTESPPAASALSALSPREREVADLVITGLRNRDIAAALGITEGTVKVHLYKVYEKLEVSSRTELVIYARNFQPDGGRSPAPATGAVDPYN